MIINPYDGINWQNTLHVQSVSHQHCTGQVQFNTLLQSSGLEHIALSNYYPSEPYYPLEDHFTVPVGVIGSPNAEHHSMTSMGFPRYSSMHLNGLGSTFSSGSASGSQPVGCDGEPCETVIPKILQNLQYSDSGGVTINHPKWSNLRAVDICYLLDLDSRMLGQEIYNDTCLRGNEQGTGANPQDTAQNIEMWDYVLNTGRRCWGFAVADHYGYISPDWRGRNILLVDEFDEHKCLKAYRDGRFYAKIKNTALCFNSITFDGEMLSVEAEDADTISFIVDGKRHDIQGNSASWHITKKNTYIRAEAAGLDDQIFSNPIMLKSKEEKDKEKKTEELIKKASVILM